MDVAKTLKRYFQTRRFTGRRGITPMKTKHRKSVPKTRSHKVEKRPYVPIRKHTTPEQPRKREATDTEEHCEDTKRKGEQDSDSGEGRKDKEEHAQIEQSGNTENSEKSVHPGPLQALPELYKWCADDTEAGETEIEAEELPLSHVF